MGNSFKISQPAPRFFPLFTSFFLLGFIVSCFLDHQVRRLYQKKLGFGYWVYINPTQYPNPKPTNIYIQTQNPNPNIFWVKRLHQVHVPNSLIIPLTSNY